MNTKLLALYGLKYNPFTPEVPAEALHAYAKLENFCWRIEHALIQEQIHHRIFFPKSFFLPFLSHSDHLIES